MFCFLYFLMVSKVILVLGVNPTDNIDELHARVEQGISEYKNNPGSKLVFTGKYSRGYKKDPGFREALMMRDYAVEKGLCEKDIITECEARDTLGNAYYSKLIIDSLCTKEIVLVSTAFHLRKAKYFFDFVYPKEYKFTYSHPKEKSINANVLSEMKKKEKEAIIEFDNVMKENNISPFEYEKIGKLIKSFYPS